MIGDAANGTAFKGQEMFSISSEESTSIDLRWFPRHRSSSTMESTGSQILNSHGAVHNSSKAMLGKISRWKIISLKQVDTVYLHFKTRI